MGFKKWSNPKQFKNHLKSQKDSFSFTTTYIDKDGKKKTFTESSKNYKKQIPKFSFTKEKPHIKNLPILYKPPPDMNKLRKIHSTKQPKFKSKHKSSKNPLKHTHLGSVKKKAGKGIGKIGHIAQSNFNKITAPLTSLAKSPTTLMIILGLGAFIVLKVTN